MITRWRWNAPTDEALVKAVRSGARGFLRKDARSAVLKHALDSLVLTGYFQNTEAHDELLVPESARSPDDPEREDILDRITARERDMLRLVCDEREFTYDEIAQSLGISSNTLENHRVRLFEKFGIKSKTGLVLFAMRWGLVE